MPSAIDEAVVLLKSRRQEMVLELAKIDRALAALDVTPTSHVMRVVAGGRAELATMSLREQILAAISEDRAYSAEEIVAAVTGNPNSVRSVLSRLARNGELVSPARGKYMRVPPLDFSGAAGDTDLDQEEDGG
jgi:hypothetical protein